MYPRGGAVHHIFLEDLYPRGGGRYRYFKLTWKIKCFTLDLVAFFSILNYPISPTGETHCEDSRRRGQ